MNWSSTRRAIAADSGEALAAGVGSPAGAGVAVCVDASAIVEVPVGTALPDVAGVPAAVGVLELVGVLVRADSLGVARVLVGEAAAEEEVGDAVAEALEDCAISGVQAVAAKLSARNTGTMRDNAIIKAHSHWVDID